MSQVDDVKHGQDEGQFDEGFAIDGDALQGTSHDGAEVDDEGHGSDAAHTAPVPAANAELATADAVQSPVYVPPSRELPEEFAPTVPARPEPEAPKSIAEVPEHIQDELEVLRKLNPDAAALALEDSAEGAAIRARLENYGADIASDKAEAVIFQRKQQEEATSARVQQEIAAVQAHNRHFSSVLQKDHPDLFSLTSDPARRAEAAKFMQDVNEWIAAKPYAEAQPLMQIATGGRDPVQVSALISQFKRERGERGGQVVKDPTAALAVPGRGAPVAPSGIGDKDDFDAGWNAHSSK